MTPHKSKILLNDIMIAVRRNCTVMNWPQKQKHRFAGGPDARPYLD